MSANYQPCIHDEDMAIRRFVDAVKEKTGLSVSIIMENVVKSTINCSKFTFKGNTAQNIQEFFAELNRARNS